MDFLADMLLGFGAVSAAVYCFILSRKLTKLKGLDQDIGSAIAVLSKQVDEMTNVLTSTKESATQSTIDLVEKTTSASIISDRLELMIAALQDLPDLGNEKAAEEHPIADATIDENSRNVTVFVRNRASRKAV